MAKTFQSSLQRLKCVFGSSKTEKRLKGDNFKMNKTIKINSRHIFIIHFCISPSHLTTTISFVCERSKKKHEIAQRQ
jgi:hypothetical protein